MADNHMMNFLLVCNEADSLKQLETGLNTQSEVMVTRAFSGREALDKVTGKGAAFDLVILDRELDGSPGKAWIEKIIAVNAMINTALVSDLDEKDFHEETEGLGILMKISPAPDESEAATVVERLSKVLSLYKNLGS